jgi:regulator of cell morphogenesis and NO signaling
METSSPNLSGFDLPKMGNIQLIRYLVFTHHDFTRDIMDEISELIHRALHELKAIPAELERLAPLWKKYRDEMRHHLNDEEKILFPWIEEASVTGRTHEEMTRQYSGAIRQMLTEHKHHEAEIAEIQQIANALSVQGDYEPVLALLSYKLRQLNTDLAEHMQIETALLFPRILGKLNPS